MQASGVIELIGLDGSVLDRQVGRAPVGVSADGRWCASVVLGPDAFGVVVRRIDGDRFADPVLWPVRRAFAWLPDWPGAFLAVCGPRSDDGQFLGAVPSGDDFGAAPPTSPPPATAGLLSSGSVLHAFDLSTGTIRWRRHGNRRWDRLAASPCGRYFAAGGPADTDRPFVLTVFDAATGAQLLTADYRTIGTTSEVHSLTFHPDGWLAAGFGDGSVRHFTLAGQMVAYPVHNAAVRALAFTADGATLLAGGTAAGARAVRLDAATKPAPPPAADRAALVRAFAFDDDPVPSTDPCDIIEAHNTEAAIDRLAALPDPPAAVDELLSANPRVGVDQGVYYGTAYAPMQALARHAARTGGVIDARFHRRIADLAMRAAPGWREKCLREIVASIDPAVRDEVLLARDDWPGWARLRLVTPERGAPLVVDMILGWPKGIYTQLCKQHGAKFNLPHGRTAKQFWENAALTLRSFGAAAVEPVRAASETPGPHRKFFRDTLAALTTD